VWCLKKEKLMWPEYEAVDAMGLPFLRPAVRVEELPLDMRAQALAGAAGGLASLVGLPLLRSMPFGAPAFVGFGLSRNQSKHRDHAALLLLPGCELPLWLCGVVPPIDL
jgi:hypothetical protein